MIFRSKSDEANRQAADWVARLHADDRSNQDEAAFSNWVAADPAHSLAFERASAIWDALGGMTIASPRQPAGVSRRMVLVGSAVLAVAGVATLGFERAEAVEYTTGVGEQRRVTLDDGSRVMLDTATTIRFVAEPKSRKLALISGRINIDIAADPRPFVIDAGKRRAVATAAQLDVRRDGEAFTVTALAGSAQISEGSTDRMVSAGERMALSNDQAITVDQPELRDLTAWQTGRLAFRNETLATAVAEMNRYSNRPLVVDDPDTAQLRLSGVYRVGDPEAFARSLAVLLSVEVETAPDAVRITLP